MSTDPEALDHYRRAWWDWELVNVIGGDPDVSYFRRLSDGVIIRGQDSRLKLTQYDMYVQGLLDDYRAYPQNWVETRPGPHDRWYWQDDADAQFVRNI